MNKKNLLWGILSFMLVAYMVVAFIFTDNWAQNNLCAGVDIVINDPTNIKFVTIEDITREIGNENNQYLSKKVSEINTYEIEKLLNSIDKIERANCVIFNNSRLRIDIEPMIPVARIFDDKNSYYINKEGKEMLADSRYLMDVPIIIGKFDTVHTAVSMLPMLSFIKNDSTWNSLVSVIKVADNRDIIVVPMIKGHVINFGDTSLVKNKFDSIKTFYKEVMPVKGWNYYDTISVKWKGQVVATKKDKKKTNIKASFSDSIDEEEVSVETMNVSYKISSTQDVDEGLTQKSEIKENTNKKTN